VGQVMSKAVPPLVYEERLCLFLDILGFKNIVNESAKDKTSKPDSFQRPFDVARIHSALSAIDRAIKPSADGHDIALKSSKQVTQFSDSIVVSYKLDERSAVFEMLYDMHFLQIELAQRGILVRGAITSGLLFHDQQIVFGPALVEAAELEKLAMYPRVILSQEIIDLGKKRNGTHHSSNDEEKSIRSLLKQDFDGMFYIDYFCLSPGDFDDGWDDLYEYLVTLREMILRLSRLTKDPSIKLKHSWMRHKFNDVAHALEKNRYLTLNKDGIPDDLANHIQNISPFR
jgi:hypothetical protein